jgi:hypothetical protein
MSNFYAEIFRKGRRKKIINGAVNNLENGAIL